jgi:hypothetical protein
VGRGWEEGGEMVGRWKTRTTAPTTTIFMGLVDMFNEKLTNKTLSNFSRMKEGYEMKGGSKKNTRGSCVVMVGRNKCRGIFRPTLFNHLTK